jgi:septal ring factor EnvC (AmiA/AmiB activator)
MKDKHSSDVIYALADYKQLVLAYRTKHAELIKSLTFWKTSVVWLSVFTGLFVLVMMSWLLENNKDLESNRKNIEIMNGRANAVSEKLSMTENELSRTREELKKKEELIRNLEKNISTASKKLLEKLLAEQEEAAATK